MRVGRKLRKSLNKVCVGRRGVTGLREECEWKPADAERVGELWWGSLGLTIFTLAFEGTYLAPDQP